VARPLTAPAVPSMPAAPAAQTAPDSRPEPGEPGPPAAPRATKAHRGDRFAGARVLVTGASSGIGAATARSLASRGALLAAAGRNEVALADLRADTGAATVPGDLVEPATARRTVAAAVAALGGLDLVVSNAGAGWCGAFENMPAAEIDRLLDLNLRSCAHLVHAALPHLRRSRGRVVLVGSIAGVVGVPGEAWYSATKAGLAGFADALRAELGPAGVGVTLVTPGVVATRFFDRRNQAYGRSRPRPVAVERLAAAIVVAVEHERDELVYPGWLSVPARLHGGFPGLYRTLARRLSSLPPALRSA
jgi:short-subunit dehydrogenase